MALRDFLPRLQFYAARQRQVEAYQVAYEDSIEADRIRAWVVRMQTGDLEAGDPRSPALHEKWLAVAADIEQAALFAYSFFACLLRHLERLVMAWCEVSELRHLLDASGDTEAEPLPDTSPGERRYKLAISHSA
jgi:hypothetical protein